MYVWQGTFAFGTGYRQHRTEGISIGSDVSHGDDRLGVAQRRSGLP